MRIVSWNVNSLRARFEHVENFLSGSAPDVLCLQETKVEDDSFPTEIFSRLGYEVAFCGQRTYNGVAIAARHPIRQVAMGLADEGPEEDKRLIAATVRGIRVYSAYVPNGKSLDSPSFAHKMHWLGQLRHTLQDRESADSPVVVCGDFNIARDDRDVYDVGRMTGRLHFSEAEHEALREVLDWGLYDSFRQAHEEGGRYSWWDYRMGAYRRNRGLRIDYAFVTQPILDAGLSAEIDEEPRGWAKPSDHAPVVVDFDLTAAGGD